MDLKSSASSPHIQLLLTEVIAISKSAGKEILNIYQQDFSVETKSDSSPLTEADLASHKLICSKLKSLTPDIPIISEESCDIEWEVRSKWNKYWLIDPLDGTKEFIKKNGEFTVNIALISDGVPILGVVYAPVLETCYYGAQEMGSWKQQSNDECFSIQVKKNFTGTVLKVMGSRSHQSQEFKSYIQQLEPYELASMGSSLKLCLIAEGKADIYPRLGPTSEWDTAAAHAVVKYAGGECLNYETNKELMYNQKESLLNPYFIVKGF
ncbi:3'(2'),5'-bisphosphate nucleotidase CysQ [Kangiella sp. HZ709]|uniref:3'(2'),5'-bisphosphate nucleotidase CysQ n=1 Tax=Kangiella sp. HZ709 TaxID=2666328 RepID=UPI0012AF0514|nr:3'(2'),5'-bisphosphate nucleotidase CysQ [Kangiella sp. HZ709]MRX27162.1 3'(2'),5'-bisphosphate nucleotidase CysQ [Kangiella sp. HZ709]